MADNQEQKKMSYLHIRIEEPSKEILQDAARQIGLSLSAYVRMILLRDARERKGDKEQ